MGDNTIDGGEGDDVIFINADLDETAFIMNQDGTVSYSYDSDGNGEDDSSITFSSMEFVIFKDFEVDLSDIFLTANATNDADTLEGQESDDVIFAGAGNDVINATQGGDDTIVSGLGDDAVTTGSGADAIFGGAGSDEISAGGGDDLLSGGSHNDL